MKTLVAVAVLSSFILFVLPSANAETGSPPSAASGSAAAPRIVKLGSLVDNYKPVLFNHENHIAIAGDCGKCHHQHGNNASLSCHDCHRIATSSFRGSVTGSFTACKNCHGVYDPASPGMPGLKVAYHRQCFQCHRGMADVGVDPKACTAMCHDKRELKPSAKVNHTPQRGTHTAF
jgi:hypothetical protein